MSQSPSAAGSPAGGSNRPEISTPEIGRPQISMVVVQPTGFCNIDCTYCYLPDRSNKHIIEQSTIARLFGEVFDSGWCDSQMIVLWHAGEPLAAPISFYRGAFATIERLRPPSVQVKHSFQTNGTLINDAWCRFFHERDVGIGVSLDGPRELHDAKRKTRSGKGTFDRTMAGIRCLQANDMPFHVLSVVSNKTLAMADELLDFYISEGIDKICFNVEESEGDYVSDLFTSGGEGSDLRTRFAAFLRRFWHRARASGKVQFVREIDHTLPRIFRPDGEPARNIQTEPLAMINVDSYGNVSSFSPELLGMKNEEYGDFLLGNINVNSLAEIHEACVRSALYRDITIGVRACKASCEYFAVCGAGAPVNKLFENGSFTGTTTSFCTLTQMVPTDLILEAYDRLEEDWLAHDANQGESPNPPTATEAAAPSSRMS